jgi:SAM-dependent methyltransferase
MDLTITPQIVKGFSDKDSKVARFRELYEKKPFLEAYAQHTDLRVADNPKGAIGREDEWETHASKQLAFLIGEGLRRDTWLLDIGCGVGRFARKVVPYLDEGCYTGVDISAAALEHAKMLSEQEGWDIKRPRWLLRLGDEVQYGMAWAHSVFTHLPPQHIEEVIRNVAQRLPPGAKFLFTYKASKGLTPVRTGLKQFATPASFFATVAARHGFKSEPLSYVFPAHQNTMRLTRLADDVDDDEDEDE